MKDLRLLLRNSGTDAADVERGFLRVSLEIKMGGDWVDCRLPYAREGGVRQVEWQRIEPGAAIELQVNNYLCRKKPEGSTEADWWETPGDYTFRASVSQRIPEHALERSGPAPQGASEWTLESNLVEVVVREPVGVDAEALAWARENGHHPVSIEVEGKFPTSYYGALMVWQRLTLHDGTPEQIADSIQKGFYPGRYSIPDASSHEGQRTVSAGEEMARWRIEHGERLLREQPDFPHEREVRLSVAVSYAALGQKDQAMRLLNAIRNGTGTPESQWASRFLTLQGWQ